MDGRFVCAEDEVGDDDDDDETGAVCGSVQAGYSRILTIDALEQRKWTNLNSRSMRRVQSNKAVRVTIGAVSSDRK
jgi:hypothetical protein